MGGSLLYVALSLLGAVAGRPSDQDAPRRRGLTPLGSSADLASTLSDFRELQADLSRSVLAIDAAADPQTLSYEISPLSASSPPPPRTSTLRSAWERPHRLRHSARRRGGSFRVNAAVFPDARASFVRAAANDASSGFSGVLRSKKGCPSLHGKERLMCPSRSRSGYHVCIDMDQLCNSTPDCPGAEDENALNCLFYRTTMGQFKKVVDAVVSLTDHMVKAEEAHREL